MKNEPTMNTVTETALDYFMEHKGMYSQADVEKLVATARAEGAQEEREKMKQSVELWMDVHERDNKTFKTDDFIKFVTEEL